MPRQWRTGLHLRGARSTSLHFVTEILLLRLLATDSSQIQPLGPCHNKRTFEVIFTDFDRLFNPLLNSKSLDSVKVALFVVVGDNYLLPVLSVRAVRMETHNSHSRIPHLFPLHRQGSKPFLQTRPLALPASPG